MDPKLFLPFVDHKCLPNKVRSFFRFGVPLNEKKWEPRKYEEAPEEKSDLIVYSYSEPAMAVDMKASVVWIGAAPLIAAEFRLQTVTKTGECEQNILWWQDFIENTALLIL